jgi:hypothetical protein
MFAVRRRSRGRGRTVKIEHAACQMYLALQQFGEEGTFATADIHDVAKSGAVNRGCVDRGAAALASRDEGVKEVSIFRPRRHMFEETAPIGTVKRRLTGSNAVFKMVPGSPNAIEAPIKGRRAAGGR